MSIKIHAVDAKGGEITPENKCTFCKGSLCCSYITQKIDKPRTKEDFKNLLWQVAHDHVAIFKDDDGWYLLIEGKCTHLLPQGGCAIYETRPQACREYSNDYCELDESLENGFKLYFPTYESLLAHCEKKFKHWDGKQSGKPHKKHKQAG